MRVAPSFRAAGAISFWAARAPRAIWAALALLGPATSAGFELSGSAGFEVRGFAHAPRFAGQSRHGFSLHVQPEFYHAWSGGDRSLLFTPFARFDSADPERTHGDVRELLYQEVADGWELRAGIGKVFWGVTESRHLVDVINQTDLIENLDGEEKLGQPMLNLAWTRERGTLEVLVLPGFRERTFPGAAGRLRGQLPVAAENARYESAAGDNRVDAAVRWTHTLGRFDIGLAHFHGTARDPRLLAEVDWRGRTRLRPYYEVIDQTSLDVQYTRDAWLWKAEIAYRSGQGPESFYAHVVGFEHTVFGIGDGRADIGLLVEHLYDGRGAAANHPFENDLFAGARLALNDAASTEVLAGFVRGVREGSGAFSMEASRRLSDRWSVELEARVFVGSHRSDLLFALRRDDYVQLSLQRFF